MKREENEAETRDALRTMCPKVTGNLAPGGRLVATMIHPRIALDVQMGIEKTGGVIELSDGGERRDGTEVLATRGDDTGTYRVRNFFGTQGTYETYLREAGLSEVRWHGLALSDEGREVLGHGRAPRSAPPVAVRRIDPQSADRADPATQPARIPGFRAAPEGPARIPQVFRLLAALSILIATACGAGDGNAEPPSDIPRKTLEIVRSYPHDRTAWTQGLLLEDGAMYESTGLRGRSTLREVDLVTGGTRRSIDLPAGLFAEGLASVGGQLIQLTWTSGVARVYDRATFALERQHSYATQGWGLCHDGARLVMSDGTSTLYFRDPTTFARQGQVTVTQAGKPLKQLNELECVGGKVYANKWMSDWIYEIDPQNGNVTAAIDASGLLTATERAEADVLNGIAYRASSDTYFITGKFWPKLFEVRFSAAR
ncbi:MAG: glutaminyl-peptide cyclotransferase [Candidatus Binatia bacterium]|nr:glutaminyl-peptide cyclotransferase [Candidatus Binatia bacterium]